MAENFYGLSDTGKVRDNNEDAFIAEEISGGLVLVCAIDGVGGYSGGEIAASIAKETLTKNLTSPKGDLIAAMKAAFIDVNDKIFEEKQRVKDHAKMACVITLAIVDLENKQFHYAHVGDTRLYLLRDNSLVKISKDHSFVGFLEDSGRLDETEAMNHLKRNEINKALGFGTEISTSDDYIETGVSPFLSGDMLLLCSDGLTDMVNKESITNVLNSNSTLSDKAGKLIEMANQNGGKDNITAVLVQNSAPSEWKPVEANAEIKKKESTSPIAEINFKKTSSVSPETKMNVNESSSNKKKDNWLAPILGLLCVLLLISTVYFFQKAERVDDNKVTVIPISEKPADSIKSATSTLQNEINAITGDTLVLSDLVYNSALLLNDTLVIPHDTLFIISKSGMTLEKGEGFAGPAIRLSENTKMLSLEGLSFRNFDVGIAAYNDALTLRKVKFTNCKIAVQNAITPPVDKFLYGRLSKNKFKTDLTISLP